METLAAPIPRAPQDKSAQETRPLTEDILESARKLLLLHGYAGLSMRKIAAEVGCKAATLYYYYKNKEAIVEALIEEGNRLHYRICRKIAMKHTSPLLRFEALLWTTLEFGINNPAYFEILFLHPVNNTDDHHRIIPGQELGRQALQEAKEAGQLHSEDIDVTNAVCFAMLNGIITSVHRNHFYTNLKIEHIKKEAIHNIMDSLKKS